MVHKRYLTGLRAQYDWVRNSLDAQDELKHGQANDDDDDDSENDDDTTGRDGVTKTPKARAPDASQRRESSSRDRERPRRKGDKPKKGSSSQEDPHRRKG